MSISYTNDQPIQNKPQSRAQSKFSRDELIKEYNQESASRARSARLKTQDVVQDHMRSAARAKAREQEREAFEKRQKERSEMEAKKRAQERDISASKARTDAQIEACNTKTRIRPRQTRVVEPLSSKEYQEKTRRSFEHYERERAVRDPYQPARLGRGERQVIDGRGTIDSRAFNELDIITNHAIDDSDKHDATLMSESSNRRWRTSNRNSADSAPSIGRVGHSPNTNLSEMWQDLPQFVKISVPVIIVLLLIIIFLFARG